MLAPRCVTWIVSFAVLLVLAPADRARADGALRKAASGLRAFPAGHADVDDRGCDWPMFRGNGNGLGCGKGDLGGNLFVRYLSESPLGWAPPVVGEGRLFLAGGDHAVRAVDLRSLEKGWEFQTGANVSVAPAYFEGKVYVASEDHSIYALSAERGTLLWRYPLGSDGTVAPVAESGIVYAGSELGALFALDAATGALRWQREFDGTIVALAIGDGCVYVGAEDHRVRAMTAERGDPLWEADLGDAPASSLAAASGKVYAANLLGRLQCLDAHTGQALWGSDTRLLRGSVPSVTEDSVYVTTHDGNLAALAPETGQKQWEADLQPTPTDSSPVCGQRRAYVYCYVPCCKRLHRQAGHTGPQPLKPAQTPGFKKPPRRKMPACRVMTHLALSGGNMVITSGQLCFILGSTGSAEVPPAKTAAVGGGLLTGSGTGGVPHPAAVLDVYPLLFDGSAPARRTPPPPWKWCQTHDHNLVGLDGRLSSDAYGHQLSYFWAEGLGTEPCVLRPFGLGLHDVVLTVYDDDGMASMSGETQHVLLVEPLPQTEAEFERLQMKVDEILGSRRAR